MKITAYDKNSETLFLKKLDKMAKLFAKGDYIAARKLCLKLVKKTVENPLPFFVLGCIAKQQKQFMPAISYFTKAIAISPAEANFYVNIATVHQELGQFGRAANAFLQAIKLLPEGGDAYLGLAICKRQLGDNKQAEANFRQAIALAPTLIDAHHNLAVLLTTQNRNEEAVEILQTVIAMNPNEANAYRNLGNAYLQLGRKEEAIKALSYSIELNGPDDSAQHMIDALSGKQMKSAPDVYIERVFDDVSNTFDDLLVDKLQYDIPAKMLGLLEREKILPNTQSLKVLDLGCGTGLVGQHLVNQIEYIDGVDLSQRMLDKTQAKKLYRELHKTNIVDFINRQNTQQRYDLIIAADVLIYLGGLEPLFSALRNNNAVNPQAHFIFSLELNNSERYQLLPSGRFGHATSYVEKLCKDYSFPILIVEHTTIRMEQGQAIAGCLFLISLN